MPGTTKIQRLTYSIAVPVLLVIALALVLMIAFVALAVPWSILRRYQAGASRRRARWWVVSLNLYAVVISASILLTSAGVSSVWIPKAFSYTLAGLAGGCLLGFIGLLTSQWEAVPGRLHYTPNRLLILAITLLVSARIFYGFWRAWNAWRVTSDTATWLAESGAAGSMGAGAVVLGYYLIYWMGLRRRINRNMRS